MADDKFLSVDRANQLSQLIGPSQNLQNAAIERQLALADYLRRDPQRHTTGAGGALGALAQMMNTYQGNKKDAQAEVNRKQMQDQDLDFKQRYLAALERAYAPQLQKTQSQMAPSPGPEGVFPVPSYNPQTD